MSVRTTSNDSRGIGGRKVLDSHSIEFQSTQRTGGSPQPGEEDLSQYLVLYLSTLDSNSYQSGDGSTWTDLSSEGNNGTISGATYFGSNTPPNFDFDGSNDRVTFASGQDVGGEITISFWVRPTLNTSINTFISTKGSASSSGYAFVANSWNTSDRKLIFEVGNGSSADAVRSAENVVGDNQWQNFVVTCVRSTGATVLYKNGSSITTDTLTVTDWGNTGTFEIGKYPPVSAYWNHGKMALAQVYTKALTATQVSNHFDEFKSSFGL
tara:strand:- start:117 stop:917 length:801 start_codon:yes stop_codon:yes gene_type:complete